MPSAAALLSVSRVDWPFGNVCGYEWAAAAILAFKLAKLRLPVREPSRGKLEGGLAP